MGSEMCIRDRYYGIKENKLQYLYRALDVLARYKEDIEVYLFEKQRNLFNMEINIVFYDVTTLYFESTKADILREFGFSKDCKMNEVQIVLGLLIDQVGRPIGFDIFAGNKFEGHTLREAIKKIERRFGIKRLIFVGDRAMLSKENIEIIRGAKYEYIVGSRIRNMERRIKEEIFKENGYEKVEIGEGEVFMYKEIKLGDGDRLICSWSEKRARSDREKRERLIKMAKDIIEKGNYGSVSKRGAKRYIKADRIKFLGLDIEKIEEDKRWDGYYGVRTNCSEISKRKVLEIYHDLWKVEEAFRILKSQIEARPIFHWSPIRIKGHLVLCFIAFLLERTLEIKLKEKKIECSAYDIREALNNLQFSVIEIEGESFYLFSPVEGLANKILRALKIAIPSKISIPEKF